METLDRDVAQTLIAKLDQGLIRPIEAKRFAASYCGVQLTGRTREQVIKSIGQHIEAPAQPAVATPARLGRVLVECFVDDYPSFINVRSMHREKLHPVTCYSLDHGAHFSSVAFV